MALRYHDLIYFYPAAFIHAPECRFDVTGPEAIISTENISLDVIQHAIEKEIPLDCSWRITVPKDREVSILDGDVIISHGVAYWYARDANDAGIPDS